MSEIKKVTVRFRTDQEQDRRAYVFLMNEGKDIHRSISRAVVAAVDGFFSRQEQVRNTHPAFGVALQEAQEAGVEVLFLQCHVEPDTLTLSKIIKCTELLKI